MRTTMATENNNKTLNVPNKREQSQTRLGYADRAEQSPQGNVPNLRFPEFSWEWEKYRLKDIANISKERIGINMLSNNNYISTENMKSDFGGVDVAINLPASGNVIKFQKGDTLLSNIRPYLKKIWQAKFDGGCSADIFVFRSNILCNSDFLYYTLANEKFISYAMSGAKGVKMPRGDKEQILKYELHLPTTIEQNKITSFLSLLDERIATQNKIIEKLESLIRGIVETHYSQSECVNQIRISELGEPFSTMNMSKEDLSEEGNECILYGELFTTYGCVIKEVKSRTHISTNKATVSQSNDLLFPASTTVDAMSLIAPSAICKEGVILGGDLFGVHVNKKYNNEYLSYLINYIYKSKLARYAQGSTIIHLHYSDIKNATLLLPTIEEQNYLAHLMRGVEEKINIEKDMLSKLYSQKAYLLYNLFI